MYLGINFTTTYRFEEPAQRLVQLLRVTPSSFIGQNVVDWRIDVSSDVRLSKRRDGYGNIAHMLYVDHQFDELEIRVHGRVLTEDRAGMVQGLPGDLPPQVFLRSTKLTQAGDSLTTLAHALAQHDGTTRDRLYLLNERLHTKMAFDTEATEIATTAEEAFQAGHGVCQDYAHIFIAAARAAGIPARYVSGHLKRRDGQDDQPATHAWAEAYDEDYGWLAFDATNGINADDAYVRVACGLDYRDAAPFSGTITGGTREEMTVGVEVTDARQKQKQNGTRSGQSQSQSQSQSQGQSQG